MPVTFKQKCFRCRKNYVEVTRRNRFVLCYDCQKNELQGEITDPKMKEMFDIPEELYKENSFLRDIKVKYLKYGELTEKQIEVFKRVAKELQGAPKEKKVPEPEENI
jgi:hypothetical protein